jgi:hypothetical protein
MRQIQAAGRLGASLLRSFVVAGFEGSTHRRRDGRRLDLVSSTRHDRFAAADYRRMARLGIHAARESLRWHLMEPSAGTFDLRAERLRVRAAATHRVEVVWDLCHFGWPDHVDVFAADFPSRFARFALRAAGMVADESPGPHWFTPMNEISFLTWAGGEVGQMNPFVTGRGEELKRQLVRAAIAGMDAVRSVLPEARFLHPEPLVNIAADPRRPHLRAHARLANDAQFEAWDMLAGLSAPELGGGPGYLDVPGANYYPDNQWILGGGALSSDHPDRTPLHEMLRRVFERYGRPLLISETGTEDRARRAWLRSVAADVRTAQSMGIPVGGICLYPILNHPGWEDDRHCYNGVWDYPGPRGGRRAYRPLLVELQRSGLARPEPFGVNPRLRSTPEVARRSSAPLPTVRRSRRP